MIDMIDNDKFKLIIINLSIIIVAYFDTRQQVSCIFFFIEKNTNAHFLNSIENAK